MGRRSWISASVILTGMKSVTWNLFLSHVIRAVKAPLMIDSTDTRVIERALSYCQGKAIINSVNLETGESRIDETVCLMRRYGAALVVGLIDEQGMAVSRRRKLEIARRAYDILVHKHGVRPTDIIFDPLVFPCATGDGQYADAARGDRRGIAADQAGFP